MAKNQTARDKITAYVAEHPGAKAGDVSEGTGLGIVRVCAILKSEVDAGRMRREGERCRYAYTLVPAPAPAEVS